MKNRYGRCLLVIAVIAVLLCINYSLAESNIDVFDDAYMYQNGFANENGRLYFQSMDWDGETCYAYLTDQNVYTYKPGETMNYLCALPGPPENLSLVFDTLSEKQMEQLYESVTYITAYNGRLFGYNVYSGKFGDIDEAGIHWDDIRLDFSCLFHSDSFYPDGILKSIITDNELYTFVIKSDLWGDACFTIYGFDLQTGASREILVEGLCAVCRGNENELLCLRQIGDTYCISLINTQSNKVMDTDFSLEDLAGTQTIGGLAYYAEKNTVYISADGYVYKCNEDGETTVFAQLSANGLAIDTSAWILPNGRYAILWDGLHVREEGSVEERSLSIAGGVPPQTLDLFASVYPDISVQFLGWTNAEELTRRVTIQDDSIDIYIVKADSTFTAMKKQGYVIPVESSKAIADAASDMDPSIRQVISDASGHIIAYPSELGIWFYGINEGYWNMLWPDRPLPKSFDDLLDAWIEWELKFAPEYPGVGFSDIEFDYSYWVYNFVSDYVMQHDIQALPNMQAPALRSVLEKLQKVYEIRLANGRSTSWDEPDTQIMVDSETGPGCIYKRNIQAGMTDRTGSFLTTSEDYLYGVPKSAFTPVSMVFDEESSEQTSARMYVYVVNPYSNHVEDSIRFIECMAQIEADPLLYYAVHPNENAPYPYPDYDQLREVYDSQRELYKNAIQRAIEENQDYDENLLYRLQYYEQWLNDENNRWLIRQDTIDAFRQSIENAPLNLHAESPYICDEGTLPFTVVMNLCGQYAEGQLSLDDFLITLSSKMKMIYLEEQ